MRTISLFLSLIIGSMGYSGAAPDEENLPVPVGLALTLVVPTEPVEIGMPALVRIHLENKSGKSYQFRAAKSYIQFPLTLRDSAGRQVNYQRRAHLALGGSTFGPEEFAPGASIDAEEDLIKVFAVSAPGPYSVSGICRIEGHRPVVAQPVTILFRSPAGN